ncbi:uncharacterized protein M421DRAFT_2879 [Didymella exigua CBS 183.55]|uniref:C3H1-type domain-containing protein n=1 Tax=Didymella exigua CBS 183.55 TaxID=1150837 RepID=A0A6A5S1J3_9PLEO|nr:uncharacterized protein M421DRAFT_2879 [Didymella exigua CBS 183.55]KAF1931387.1 hypothetical protein M421DRAFT_2879 [Didymella exigua CBS 183.55]
MASNHVPSDQVPLQGQSIYTDPSSFSFFPNNIERYGTPSWEAQLHQNTALTPNSSNQNWHGTYPQQVFNTHSQTYAGQTQAFRTASPYQYGQFTQHGTAGSFGHAGAVDPSLGLNPSGLRQQQQSPYPVPVRTATPSSQSGTVAPQALQQLQNARASASPFQVPKSTTEQFTQQAIQAAPAKPVRNPAYEIPRGKKSGGFYVLDTAVLAKATNSTPLNKLVTLAVEPIALSSNRTALPLYTARQSIKELKKIGADNKKLLAKLSSSKSSLSRAIKFSSKNNAGSPGSLKREVSDSSDYTDSSEDDSEYSDSEDEEVSPLPASRPDDDPHKAVCYDVIKASWFSPRSPMNSEKIKFSMRDLWEVLNTIQKRWRADSKAVAEAEEAKKIGELPTLKSRVTSQRDLLQTALKAALEHAHPDVLYHLGQVKPFLYLCYQFLANRFKAKDFDGPLPSAIYEILAKCGTLTTELVEETKVSKALVSMKKQANDKNKAFIQQIVDAAAAGSKKAKANSPPAAETTEAKGAKRPASEPAVRTAGEGLKKVKPAEASTVTVKKEAAVGVPKPTAAAAIAAASKRPGEKSIGAPAPVRARVNPVTNKSSSIFASLNAATKKPAATATAPMATKSTVQPKTAAAAAKDKKPATAAAKSAAFSFASTMAALTKPKEAETAPTRTEKDVPNETPEEKAKRMRKEARRHLRVTFRPDASLVAIKYFSHDPEEELGHDENFTRDAGDLGGEGHMFKQHKELEEEEDDDDDETEYRPWTEPSQVDFSVVDPEERKRNYMPYGGGENVPTCPEKEANERRENDILMVFYTSPADIPPSPHEPPEQTEDNTTTVTIFGTPPDKCLNRAPKAAAPTAPADLDFSKLESIVAQLANQNQSAAAAPVSVPAQPTYAPPAPAPASGLDLAALLASFGQQQPPPLPVQTPAPAPPQFPALSALPAGVPPPPPGAPPAEMAAFLAAMQAQGGALPPMPPGFPPMAFSGAPFSFPQAPQPDATAYQQQPPDQYYQQDYQQSNGGTKRPRDDGNNNDRNGQGKKHKAGVGGKPHKVLACKFFQKGTCNKGDNCTYIHDLNM